MSKVAIIDYGLGNIYSLEKAIEFLNKDAIVTNNVNELKKCSHIILPGVGAFPKAIKKIKELNLIDYIKSEHKLKPIMGICLGMQLLMSSSDEIEPTNGLDLVKGNVIKFTHKSIHKSMNVGWKNVKVINKNDSIFNGISDHLNFYFVHMYHVKLLNQSKVYGISKNGEYEYTSFFQDENLVGCQFHPEKSGKVGLKLLKNFLKL